MLAQLVEQRTFNPFVVGSIPAHPTKISKGPLMTEWAFSICVDDFVLDGLTVNPSAVQHVGCKQVQHTGKDPF